MNVDYQYLVGRIQSALATDPRSSLLDVKVMVVGNRIHLTGEVPSEARRNAIARVVSELLPGIDIRNELTVFDLTGPHEAEVLGD